MIPSILSLFIIGLHDVRCALIEATRRVCIAFPCDQLSGTFLVFTWVCSGLLGRALVEPAKAKIAQRMLPCGHTNSLKSVVVRVVRADVQPLIAVPNYAGVRVVSGIVVGISRRETQTCTCYERHKATTSKAGHTKTTADGGGANPWGYRGRAEPGTNRACAEPWANRGRAQPWANRGRADSNTPKATTDGRAAKATTDGRAPKATTDGRAPEATTDGRAPEATADGSTAEATAPQSTPAEATTLSKSSIREHRC